MTIKKLACGLFVISIFLSSATGQEKPTAAAQEKPAPPAKPRIFVAKSDSWEISGGGGGSSSSAALGSGWNWVAASRSSWGSYVSGGARGQTAELIKTFGERCPEAYVNDNPRVANYAVVFDHEGGKIISKDNKIAVFNRAGDAIFSHSTRSLGNSIKGACGAILSDWQVNGQATSKQVVPPGAAENLDPNALENQVLSLGIAIATWERGGAEILEIEPGSVAEHAYLHVGDVINFFNGRPVKTSPQLAAELSKRGNGSQVRLGYLYRSISIGYVQKETVVILGQSP
jgi:hypothetical protein